VEFESACGQLSLELLLREIYAYIVPIRAFDIEGYPITHTAAYRA